MATIKNFKGKIANNRNSKNEFARPMNINKKEDMDAEFEDRIIDWATFYKRNIHRFVEHYFGIKLHFYLN